MPIDHPFRTMCAAMRKAETYKDKWGNVKYRRSRKSVARAVMERLFGHKLQKGSVVHHKNRDKSDNRLPNLWVFRNQKEHDRTHRKDKRRTGRW